MSKKHGSRSEKPDARGGKYFLLPHCLVKSEAWRTGSPRMIKAVFVLWGKHNGFNNGKIFLNLQDLAHGMDAQNHKGNSRALAEAEARGIIEETRRYGSGARLAREFRLTFMDTKNVPATHEYLSWRPGDLGTRRKPTIGNNGKKRVAETAVETSSFIAETAEGLKLSSAETAAETSSADAKPPKFPNRPFAETAAHIVSHPKGSESVPSDHEERAGGLLSRTTASAAGVASAAPSEEELRERSLAFLQQAGRGWQGKLAEQAGIPPGTFSKFLHNRGPLSARARIRLTCAFPKTEAAQRKKGRAA